MIIPTIGRPEVRRAVESVLSQSIWPDELELIVVNDSGKPLPAAEWQSCQNVALITTNRRERSVARNTGAALARGRYLCFLDDDDWLLPGALQELLTLSLRAPDAVWLYGGIRVVGSRGQPLGEVNSGLNGNCLAQIMGGAWVPIQTSLVRAEAFFEVGGFDPHICGTEDQDLCRRIAATGRVACTDATVACLFRGDGWQTSTLYERAPEDTRLSRDNVVNEAGVFGLMVSSANSPYWYGRVFHVYAGLATWHLRHKRMLKGISRLGYALASLWPAGRQVFSGQFWRAVRASHVPGTLHFIEPLMGQESLQSIEDEMAV